MTNDSVAGEPPSPIRAAPWGFWSTLGLSVAITVTMIGVQGVIAFILVMIYAASGRALNAEQLVSNGLLWGLAALAAAPVTVGLCVLFAWLKRGMSVTAYLGLLPVRVRWVVRWCLGLLGMLVLFDGVSALLGRPLVPEVMLDAYRSAGFLPLFWLALIVGAPVGEEIFFRGFLFTGLEHSRVGPWGAIGLSSLTWAAIHLQYDAYGMLIIFVTGLLFGYARWRTGSVYPSLVMHALMNLVATIQVDLLIRFAGPS